MFAIKSATVLFLMIIYVSRCQRRIKEGQEVNVDKRYVVYLVKAPNSELGYDAWLCGGAIVGKDFVVTSAACVNDVEFLYVIAGYKKYVPDSEIETDKCTSKMKKKVIYTCSPTGYNLKYAELDYWSFIDIALLKVESPFDFNDPLYETLCSYKPTTIRINYEEKYQTAGQDALVLGWGHLENWRKPGDPQNYNQPTLRYAPTLLLDKEACMQHYSDYANMSNVISHYMICSLGKGNIDDAGNTIQLSLPLLNGCTSIQQKLLGFEGVSCEKRSTEESFDEDDTRKYNKESNHTDNFTLTDFNKTHARRSGICQNDHGGPLVTWAGSYEVLIGVASVFKVSEDYECMGPYLYTSTRCTGLFLDCILNSAFPSQSGRRYLCNRPASERGYDTIERTISWKGHPAGSAENENIERTGPKPKISPGLKYLTNNNPPPNVENEKHGSNNKFQAYKNPPIVSNEPKNRFLVQARGSESVLGKKTQLNDKHQEGPNNESNKMYLANNSPVPVRNKPKEIDLNGRQVEATNRNPAIASFVNGERFKIKGRIPEIKNISEKQSLQVNDRSPEIPSFPVNGRSSGQETFSANERYQFNNRNPGNETNTASVEQPKIERPLANQRYPVIGRYPVSVRRPKNLQIVPARMAVRSVRPIRN